MGKKTALAGMAMILLCVGCGSNQYQGAYLKTGEQAPAFEFKSHDGTAVSLTALTKKGPVVLTLLRGFF
ncbi:MAG: hypothetical protein QNJ97_19575 [Myxococcota bacterium]|nr:hypothetical protein [Myxococcota bacterium]